MKNNSHNKSKTKLSRRSMIIGAVLLTLLTFGVYELGRHTQKWGENDELRAIKSEKLASTGLLGLKLIEARQSGEGTLVGKTMSPQVTRTFEARNDNVEATKQQIIEYAEKEGWVYDSTSQVDSSWKGHKTKRGSELTIIISEPLRYDSSVRIVIF